MGGSGKNQGVIEYVNKGEKVRTFLYVLIMTLVVLVGCKDQLVKETVSNKENTISNAVLTKKEKEIITTTSDQSFVYDFIIDKKYKSIKVWVEKYEYGKQVQQESNGLTMEVQGKGNLLLSTTKLIENENKIMFHIGVHNDGASTVAKFIETIPEDPEQELRSVLGSALDNKKNQTITSNMVLGSICYKKGDGAIRTLPSDIFSNVEQYNAELEQYDVVFLLRANFTK